MRAIKDDRRAARRGVTLMEMLVTVALLVLIMSILVAIFRSATEAITIHQVSAVLDQDLRRVDTMIRQDLDGITATLTPPLNPKDDRGYFSYGENELADAQGEDTDDWVAFTAKAPSYQPFVGYIMVPVTGQDDFSGNGNSARNYKRVAVKSDYAEVIYFLRNHTLYRRVFLIQPQPNIYIGTDNNAGNPNNPLPLLPGAGRGNILGTGGFNFNPQTGVYIAGVPANGWQPLSWQALNDVSARPASAAAGTWCWPELNTLNSLTQPHNRALHRRFTNDYFNAKTGKTVPDGHPDDVNGDGIDDFYPTMYPQIFNGVRANSGLLNGRPLLNWPGSKPLSASYAGNANAFGFPFDYSLGYSVSSSDQATNGPVHRVYADSTGTTLINHAPLEIGDPLGYPTSSGGYLQTWWGFPTKKEMLSSAWTDPVWRINVDGTTPPTQSASFTTPLPPMNETYRLNPQPFNDGVGAATLAASFGTTPFIDLVDEDAIATNVRSVDIKVLDTNTLIYQDLGYGDINNPSAAGTNTLPSNHANPQLYANYLLQGFSHEGRMPPLTGDMRLDAQFPYITMPNPNYPEQPNNIGDDQSTIHRLRRVYDTWSTDYAYPPWQTLDPINWPPYDSPADPNYPLGTLPNLPPIPGYPPPYPASLRAMQIQIRFVDPRNTRLKVLTIRHDFTDNQ